MHTNKKKLFAKDIPAIKKLYLEEKLSITEIAKIFGVSYAPMQRFFKKHAIPTRSLKESHHLSKTHGVGLKKWRELEGAWNKGLSVASDERMASLVEKGRQTQIKNGKSRGANNPMFGKVSRVKGGYRKDLGHSVRSSWEAAFGRILNYLDLSYLYEEYTFLLKKGDTYTPDFYIPTKNKFYEIKGFASNDKYIRFKKEYPQHKLVVIDERRYKRLLKTFGKHIHHDTSHQSTLTAAEIAEAFAKYCFETPKKPTLCGFSQKVGIPTKTISRIFNTGRDFILAHSSTIMEAEANKLKLKFNQLQSVLGRRPSRRELDRFFSRSSSIRNLYFEGKYSNVCKFVRGEYMPTKRISV